MFSNLNKPKEFLNNVLRTDETKAKIFGHNASSSIKMKHSNKKYFISNVKHGSGGMMIWA